MDNSTVEKIYAGFLGKCFGVRLGAPVEPQIWTYKKIREIYGNMDHYTKYYKTFAADDDTNGPVFFHRMLLEKSNPKDFRADDVAKAWLNFGRENIGMFWWGGNGVSTEHTAYLNLLKGIIPPESGSIAQNGKVLAEQIGGQIFIDTWGLLFPNNPVKAAEFALKAASVSHDGDALEGAKFIAACIAIAFSTDSITDVVAQAMTFVDPDSTYYKVISAVLEFHAENPDDWFECREYLEQEWGYDKYGGVVHVIPNAGVCMMALLYGDGDFARTIEIASMSGWDTDCNAGNCGTILGVLNGVSGLPAKYRTPTNDRIITSSVIGELNIVDIPTFARETAILSCQLNDEPRPDLLDHDFELGKIDYDFSLPGSTHGFMSDNYFKTELRHVENKVGHNALGILIDRMVEGDQSHIFTKTYYRRRDFSDERYKPCFAPQVYPGQTASFQILLEKWQGGNLVVRPYVKDTFSESYLYLSPQVVEPDQLKELTFEIPDMAGSFPEEVGLLVETDSELSNRFFGQLNICSFKVSGKPKYSIDFSKQSYEFLNVTPFAFNNGQRTIEENKMVLECDKGMSCFTGDYYTKDIDAEFIYQAEYGMEHQFIFKARGIRQYYAIGFDGYNSISLIRNDFGSKECQRVEFAWKSGEEYRMRVNSQGNECKLFINGQEVLCYDKIDGFQSGMFGYRIGKEGKARISEIHVQ
ncbi:ADP-ribosylglycohydrolase family protein [Lapidilactobacillus achengensis]|uniref:ADP-ribosylglycohydrolase family protein n=1 Tax=Lapidilactobacillus achengensis TaxID=2486000 RepID=A0ABW1UN89_9LACO|nr:ADP-ribosylglycohydrolase family protein [Lapidilactobacillus achengensis]